MLDSIEKRFWNSHSKYVHRTKESMIKEVREESL